MEHNKNRTVISDFGNAVTETIWAIGRSIVANAVPERELKKLRLRHD